MNKEIKKKSNKIVLDHIALASSDIEKAVNIFKDLGLEFEDKREIVHDQNVMTAFAPIDENAHLEILTPLENTDGAIKKFIENKGQGIHHICFRVENIETLMDSLKLKGYTLIYPVPQIGARGCLVNFIHPKSTGGVLVEILQSVSI